MTKMKNSDIKVGQKYEIRDIYGMISHEAKFIGTGHPNEMSKIRHTYYAFKLIQEKIPYKHYRYAICRPYFNECEFGGFEVVKYGDNLDTILQEDQPIFVLDQ